MDLGSQSLHDIEGAVEDWRQKVLPDMEADLLDKAQSQFTQQAKVNSLVMAPARIH